MARGNYIITGSVKRGTMTVEEYVTRLRAALKPFVAYSDNGRVLSAKHFAEARAAHAMPLPDFDKFGPVNDHPEERATRTGRPGAIPSSQT
jgi:hypothetical protein